MFTPSEKPIIFLAFANDRAQRDNYLRNLGREADSLRSSLQQAAALCEVVERHSVTPEQILQVFQHYGARLAIFHYAGHADDYTLLLESSTGGQVLADGRGLAGFLQQQRGLQLVFLNACSTRIQADDLRTAGAPLVIATSRAIDDELAAGFATAFYQSLAGGDTIAGAFAKAKAAVQFSHGDLNRHLHPSDAPEQEHTALGLPWELYTRPGVTLAPDWSLPAAAGNPLWNLPPLPALDLPVKPFRDLNWFRRADAVIFFGRGQQIRQLYTTVTDANVAPIVLFYGQSGVGKSSLLDAGLLPRLEQTHQVRYLRRDQEQGLLGTLLACLPGIATLDVNNNFKPILAAWRAVEQEFNRPFTLIVDQIEEYFTRPNRTMPTELEHFLQALVALFADHTQRPQGKLILSFRKEWLAEIEKRLGECSLPFTKIFLERLDEAGVFEAISGITQTPSLQQHYGLTLEDGLADEIAHDLLKDREAAVAPMLQILLTRLWEEATQRNRAQPRFDRALYDQLRRAGLRLPEFLNRQLTLLQEQQPDVVNSGLALDLLSFHTTPLGTAEQHDFAVLQATYHHRAGILPEVLRSFQNLYLLVDPSADQADALPKSRLAHDTLAPLVRARFDESDWPGQRARRILETRAVEWEDDIDSSNAMPLDRQDLAVVEQGATGMRIWTATEQRLITASRQREAIRRRNLRIWQGIGVTAITVILATAWIALILRGLALQREAEAKSAKAIALTREAEAKVATGEAQKRAREAKAVALAAKTQTLLQQNAIDSSPSLPLLLARQAVLTTLTPDQYVAPDAETVLRNAIASASPWLLTIPKKRHTNPVMALAISPDGQTLLSASSDSTARLWNLLTGGEVQRFVGHNGPVWSAQFNPDGTQIMTASVDGTIRRWDATSGQELLQIQAHTGTVWSALYSIDGQAIFSAGEDHAVRMWEATTGQPLRLFAGHKERVMTLAIHPDGKLLASAGADQEIRLWEIATGKVKLLLQGHHNAVTALRFLQQGQRLVSADGDGMVRLWETNTGAELRVWQAHEAWIDDITVNKAESLLATASHDATIRLWEIASGAALTTSLSGHSGVVNAIVFTPNEKQIISGSDDQSIRRWDLASGRQVRFLAGHQAPVIGARYASNGKFVVSADKEGTILLHDPLTGNQLAALPSAGPIATLDLASDNRTLVSGGQQTIRLWDLISRTITVQFEAHTDTVLAVKISPDHSLLATAGADSQVCLWQVNPHQKLRCLEHPDWVRALAFTADSKTLISGCDDGKVRLWALATQQNVMTTTAQPDYIYALALSPAGNQLAMAVGKDIQLWDFPLADQPRQTLAGHTGAVNAVVYGRDGNMLASAGNDYAIRLWDITTGKEIGRFDGHEQQTRAQQGDLLVNGVTSVDASPDGTTLVTSGTDNTVRFWDIRPNRPNHQLDGLHHDQLESVTISKSGQYAVTASDGLVAVWALATETPVFTIKADKAAFTFASLSPDEKILAAASDDRIVRLWNWRSGQLLQELPHLQTPFRLAFDPTGERIAIAVWDGTAYVWDVASGQLMLRLFASQEWLRSVAFSHDGRRLVTADDDSQVRVWDAVRGGELFSVTVENTNAVNIAIFSPDDQMILVGVDATPFGGNVSGPNSARLTADFALRLLAANTGEEVRQFAGHTDTVLWADFDESGRTFVTSSQDKTVRFWDTDSGRELRTLQLPDWTSTVFFLPDNQTVILAGPDGIASIWYPVEMMLRQAEALTQREPALFWRSEQGSYQIPAMLSAR